MKTHLEPEHAQDNMLTIIENKAMTNHTILNNLVKIISYPERSTFSIIIHYFYYMDSSRFAKENTILLES